ncbi:unnamed protein product, partial [Mesorhabditis spiculigera]
MLYGITPIKTIATYGATAERLRQEITLGLIAPSSKLPAERRFADDLGVARITLREALKMLDAEGYLDIRRGASGGAFIVDEDRLRAISLAQLHKSQAGCLRALEFWRINQLACARFAAVRRTPADLKRMREVFAVLREDKPDYDRRRAESELCLAVAMASGNVWLLNAIHDSLAASFLPFVEVESQDDHFPLEAVDQLIVAIQSNDKSLADAQMDRICCVFAGRFKSILMGRNVRSI